MTGTLRKGWTWGVRQPTIYGLTLTMTTGLHADREDVEARSYGMVAYVHEIADDDFVGGSYFKVVEPNA